MSRSRGSPSRRARLHFDCDCFGCFDVTGRGPYEPEFPEPRIERDAAVVITVLTRLDSRHGLGSFNECRYERGAQEVERVAEAETRIGRVDRCHRLIICAAGKEQGVQADEGAPLTIARIACRIDPEQRGERPMRILSTSVGSSPVVRNW